MVVEGADRREGNKSGGQAGQAGDGLNAPSHSPTGQTASGEAERAIAVERAGASDYVTLTHRVARSLLSFQSHVPAVGIILAPGPLSALPWPPVGPICVVSRVFDRGVGTSELDHDRLVTV